MRFNCIREIGRRVHAGLSSHSSLQIEVPIKWLSTVHVWQLYIYCVLCSIFSSAIIPSSSLLPLFFLFFVLISNLSLLFYFRYPPSYKFVYTFLTHGICLFLSSRQSRCFCLSTQFRQCCRYFFRIFHRVPDLFLNGI